MARLALLLAALAACEPVPPPSVPQVVVSVPPQAWFVERLAGDAVEIAVLLPPGASPAHYEPSMRELQALARARLYVRVGHPGFPLEGAWLDALLPRRCSTRRRISARPSIGTGMCRLTADDS